MTASQARRKGEREFEIRYVRSINLIESAESCARIILGGHHPLPVVGLILNLTRERDRHKQRKYEQPFHGLYDESCVPMSVSNRVTLIVTNCTGSGSG